MDSIKEVIELMERVVIVQEKIKRNLPSLSPDDQAKVQARYDRLDEIFYRLNAMAERLLSMAEGDG